MHSRITRFRRAIKIQMISYVILLLQMLIPFIPRMADVRNTDFQKEVLIVPPNLIHASTPSHFRYQGYICPGILVLLASANNLEVVADAWRRRVLTPPANCKISQVGLSNGCVVKPVLQSHQVALPDIICVILAR